jgi:hypothetical protein
LASLARSAALGLIAWDSTALGSAFASAGAFLGAAALAGVLGLAGVAGRFCAAGAALVLAFLGAAFGFSSAFKADFRAGRFLLV